MIEYCDKLTGFIKDIDFSGFDKSELHKDACSLCILQIGELVHNLTDEFKQEYSDIPWRQIRSMRNIVVHHYGVVDTETLWYTIIDDIPVLREYCQKIRASKPENKTGGFTMEIKKVTDAAFRKYGRVVDNVDFTGLVEKLAETPCPADTVYEPSVALLEALPVFEELKTKTYGELPIQIGYCNGNNYKLNALEYHRSSEINVAGTDAILLVGWQPDIADDGTYDTSKVEAFLLPKGTAVEVYATTLHYAPCNAAEGGFRVAIVLPKDTNLPLEKNHAGGEDARLTAKNKWLIGHPEGGLPEGSPLGLVGENISLK